MSDVKEAWTPQRLYAGCSDEEVQYYADQGWWAACIELRRRESLPAFPDLQVFLPAECLAFSIWRVNMAILRHVNPSADDGQWSAEAWEVAGQFKNEAYTTRGDEVPAVIARWVDALWEKGAPS